MNPAWLLCGVSFVVSWRSFSAALMARLGVLRSVWCHSRQFFCFDVAKFGCGILLFSCFSFFFLFVDGVVVWYLRRGSLRRLLGGGALQNCIRREEFNATLDYAVCCILLLRCFPSWMTCGCFVSALPFCCVGGWCGFQYDCVDGGDYRNGEIDDFVESNHLVLFLCRINLPPM